MPKNRLEAFSDGVIAIIITIMVLELKVPHGASLSALKPLVGVLLSYVLSFIFVGIYWNNHHHLLHAAQHVNAGILWANLHLLFWLSLVPFATGWFGENHGERFPTALYGFVLLMAAIAYTILQNRITCHPHHRDRLVRAFGRDLKGKLSLAAYVLAVVCAFYSPQISYTLYVLVAILWIVPDRRVEEVV